MPRSLRIQFPNAMYHIYSRGNNKQNIFKSDCDRLLFLWEFSKIVEKYGWVCHAYCLMNNHYHLLLETPFGNLSDGMRDFGSNFVKFMHVKNQTSGRLFTSRYKSRLIVDDVYLLELSRYIVMNPVRARLVNDPIDWCWSSYRAYIGVEQPPTFLTVNWLLQLFGTDEKFSRKCYVDFTQATEKADS